MTACQIAVITALCQAGRSAKDIAKQTDISGRTVRRWCKKFKDSPDGNVDAPKTSPGRPRKWDPRALNIIRRQLEATPSITARQIKHQNPVLFANLSIRTIQLMIHDKLGYTQRRARKKSLVTYKQRMARLQFACRCMHWNMRLWKNVIFLATNLFLLAVIAITIMFIGTKPLTPTTHLEVC